jgi:hypothetical protein
VEKKALFTAAFISVLLLSAIAGTQLLDLGRANPVWLNGAPTEPITTPPSFYVYSPVQNETHTSTQVLLNFIIIKPEAWFRTTSSVPGYSYAVFGNVTSVYYTVDGGERQNIPMHDLDNFYFNENPPRTLSFSTSMDLTGGVHSVVIGVEAVTYYVSDMYSSHPFSSVVVQAHSESVNFTVEVPKPEIIAPVHKVYNETGVPLTFVIYEASSLMSYSLDGQDNVTISGNTTLTGLPNGDHNVTVYATDEVGNTGASQTITFTIAKPEPQSEPFPTTLVVASIASVVIIGAGVVLYFSKIKKTSGKTK